MKRILVGALVLTAAAMSQAVTFTNVIISSPPLSTGSSWTSAANAISFFAPNAVIVEGVPVPSNVLNIQYDAISVGQGITMVDANISAPTLGSGTVIFTETVIALDAMGNELGQIGGGLSHVFNPSSGAVFSGSINLMGSYERIRVKKGFVIAAPATTPGLDMAAVATINQSVQVVPEPATMTALGIGALALLRRRRSK